MRYLSLILIFCFFVLPGAHARAGEAAGFGAQGFTLENGLQVVVLPNPRAPVVTQMVWYRTGAIDEPPGQSGVAHFVEHLMFKGTEKIPPGEFSKRIRALGGNDNAFTSQDYTAYFQTIAKEHLPAIMAMEADRMSGLVFPPDDVDSERKVVIEERRERTENDPHGYFAEQLRAALFPNHSYANPVVGWLHELGGLNRENVKNFYEQHYAPNNAILIVGGDVTVEAVRDLAQKIYGPIPARQVPLRRWTEVPPLLGKARLTLQHESIRQPILYRMARVPSYTQNKNDSLALQVLAEILDGGAATRLYQMLVVNWGMASSASLNYSASALSDAVLSVSATPSENVSMENLEWALDEVFRALIKDGVTEQELREAKDRLKDEVIFARDSLQGPAMIFGQALVTGSTVEDVEGWPDLVEAVTAAQVQDVARRYLDPDHYGTRPYVSGWLMPPGREEEGDPLGAQWAQPELEAQP